MASNDMTSQPASQFNDLVDSAKHAKLMNAQMQASSNRKMVDCVILSSDHVSIESMNRRIKDYMANGYEPCNLGTKVKIDARVWSLIIQPMCKYEESPNE